MGDSYEDAEKRIYEAQSLPGQHAWYYVVADNVKGRNFIDGPHGDYDEAYSWGMRHLDCAFIVEECDTRNRDEATRVIRHRLTETQGVNSALERIRHTTGEN